jgi:hypothetical protein
MNLDNIGYPVQDSVWTSVFILVHAFAGHSIGNSVWDSIQRSVVVPIWDSVWSSVRVSVWLSLSRQYEYK